MRQTPLLILAYNRPDKVHALIERLRPQAPQHVMVAVDGPKPGNAADAQRVQAVQDAVANINWTSNVEVRFRPVNLGLQRAVVDAVTWATDSYGQAVILEEDVLPGPDFLAYSTHMLERYRTEEKIAHISGYNVVPSPILQTHGGANRLTRYPESIAWATWDRAWKHYDDNLTWALNCSVKELSAVTGSLASALRWKLNFHDAAAGRISTWAYRWIGSMWAQGSVMLSPNHNLVTYAGQDEGTNSTLTLPWDELPLYDGSVEALYSGEAELNAEAEEWISRQVFGGTPLGVAKGTAISVVLAARKIQRNMRAARA